MSTQAIASPSQTPSRPRRRWLRGVLLLFGLVVVVPLGIYGYMWNAARLDWAAAEAETDRLDPRWRLADIEADRAVVPDAENSALHIIAARKSGIAAGALRNNNTIDRIFKDLTPTAQLNAQQAELLRVELAKIAKPLEEARKLKDMPRGRYPLTYADDPFLTLIPDQQESRTVMHWLQHDAYWRSHDHEDDGAVESCQAILNVGRALGDEPFTVSHLIRVAMHSIALEVLERVLAQGDGFSEACLQGMQSLVQKEIRESTLLHGERGMRAIAHDYFTKCREGTLTFGTLGDHRSPAKLSTMEAIDLWAYNTFPALTLKNFPDHLRFQNKWVEAAKLPHHQRGAKLTDLLNEPNRKNNRVTALLPGFPQVHTADSRSQALLRSALVALACERYRIKHREWPATLELLVKAKWLDAVPLDPFDGQPLRYLETKDGVVVYCVGTDLVDNQGNVDPMRYPDPGMDIGFRLWHTPLRRQAPLPPVALPEGN